MMISTSIRGQSAAAQYVDKSRDVVAQHFRQSAALSKQSAYDDLFQVWDECRHANWDGNEAFPVSEATYKNTYRLIQALPLGCDLPSVGVEPDGELTLEWYRNSKWVLSVSVSHESVLHYAALFGHSNSRGSVTFLNGVPDILMTLINKVMLNA